MAWQSASEPQSETEREAPAPRIAEASENAFFASLEIETQRAEKAELSEPSPLPSPSAIFGYWRDTRLRSHLIDLEIEDAQHFFSLPIARRCQAKPGDLVHVLSLARDDGRFELDLAQRLVAHGNENFRFECVDLRSGVREQRTLDCSDEALNDFVANVERDRALEDIGRYDVILSDTTLWSHAVAYAGAGLPVGESSETSRFAILDALLRAMKPDAVLALTELLTEPSTPLSSAGQEVAERIWQLMPLRYRDGHGEDGDPHAVPDFPRGGEPPHEIASTLRPGDENGSNPFAVALRERFECEAWASFGHIVDAFIGPYTRARFDPELEADRRFIDQVTRLDEARIAGGLLAPRYLAAWLQPRSA